MKKLSKAAVDFEHPAKGPHHCGECRHFAQPNSCEIVRGVIDKGDWCRRFKAKGRAAGAYDHPRSRSARDDAEHDY